MEGGEIIVRNAAAIKTPTPINDSIFMVLLNFSEGSFSVGEDSFCDHKAIPYYMHYFFLLAALVRLY